MVSPPRKTEMTLSLALCLRVSHFTLREQLQTTLSSLQERKRDCTTRSLDHSVIRDHVCSRDAPLQLGVYVLRVRVLAAKLKLDVKTSRANGPNHCVPISIIRR